MGQAAPQCLKADVDVGVPSQEESVGEEGEHRSVREIQLSGLEGQAAQAQRRARGQTRELDGAVGVHHRGRVVVEAEASVQRRSTGS